MARIFKLNSTIKSIEEDGDQLKIVGYASTADTDRVGDVIVPDAWTKAGGLDNYKNNPILLFNHNYSQPIGRATSLEVDGTGLKIEASISKSAGPTYGLVKDGVLSTFSVGFMIKNADYNETTDGYIIREAELLEVSVVSVPCNQKATFSVSKSLGSAKELAEFNKEVNALNGHDDGENEANVSDSKSSPNSGTDSTPERVIMTPEEIAALVAKSTADALAAQKALNDKEAAEKAAREAEEKNIEERIVKHAEAASKSTEERLLTAFGEKLAAKDADMNAVMAEFKSSMEEKSAELRAMSDSKRMFGDRSGGNSGDVIKDNYRDVETAVLLAKALKKDITGTKFGKELMEKFNTHSTVTVGTDRLETTVSTTIERDIENELVLKPLFREIIMNSAQQSFPLAPDAGYAEITSATTASGSQPNGNVDQRGAGYGAPYAGITLTEKLLSTIKMIGKGYLGNETEEDSIIPILPLIKDAMVRSHARGIENMILAGNTNQGVYTSGAANGLLKFAETNGRTITASSLTGALTAADLFALRKVMGKYGRDPRDIVYIVSQDAWYQLAEDPAFLNADQVTAANAVKLTGSVGRIYNSDVIVCDEFAASGANNYYAMALNARNFVIPRLRGMTVESEYSVENQRTVLVASQRLGFDEIIAGAKSVVAVKRPAS
jgi:HK97 family phage prohead protease